MTNEERRVALAKARRMALMAAEVAQGASDKTWGDFTGEYVDHHIKMANMWAHVANAMKVGQSLEADGVIPDPGDLYLTREVTR